MEQTARDIMGVLQKWSQEKRPIMPEEYLDAAAKLNSLQGDEDDKLFQLEQKNALKRLEFIQNGMTISAAKAHVEGEDTYREARNQRAFVERIKETIRISKIRARLASDEMRLQ